MRNSLLWMVQIVRGHPLRLDCKDLPGKGDLCLLCDQRFVHFVNLQLGGVPNSPQPTTGAPSMVTIVFTPRNPCARPMSYALLSGAHENAPSGLQSQGAGLPCAPHPCRHPQPLWCSGNHHHCICTKAKSWLPTGGSRLRAEPAGSSHPPQRPPSTASLKHGECHGCGMSLS